MALREQTLHASKLVNLPLILPVLGDKVLGLRQPRAPQADTDQRLRAFFMRQAARMQTGLAALAPAKGRKPERIDAEFFVYPVDEVLRLARWKEDVLDDVMLCHAVLVETVVEDLGVEETVESPVKQADEGDAEVRDDVTPSPESAAVVAEEAVCCGYYLDPSVRRFDQGVADMKIVPERVSVSVFA